jgi:hypothetical protein
MRISLLTRFGMFALAGAIATTGALATTGMASASTAAPAAAQARHATTLSIHSSKHHITHAGRKVIVRGVLRSDGARLAGKTVRLFRAFPGHGFKRIRKMKTNALGKVRFVLHPVRTARYVLVFRGTKDFKPHLSRIIRIRVT